MSVLTAKNLEKSYFSKTLFQGLSFQLQTGDKLALVGENGAGKSTLFRLLAGEEQADRGEVIRPQAYRLAYLHQLLDQERDDLPLLEMTAWFQAQKELEAASEGLTEAGLSEEELKLRLHGYQEALQRFDSLGGFQFESEFLTALSALGLPEDAIHRPFGSFSGGEKMRVQLALLLLDRPDILLLDEPTNHLDLPAIEWLIGYLKAYKGALLLVSHDRYLLDEVSNRTGFLENQQLRLYPLPYSQALLQKQEEDRFALSRQKDLEKEMARQAAIQQTFLSHDNFSGYRSKMKLLAKLEEELKALKARNRHSSHKMSLHILPQKAEDVGKKNRLLLSAKGLGLRFGEREIFRNLQLEIRGQDKIVLLGPNGAGKTSLLRLLLGELWLQEGQLSLSPRLSTAYLAQRVEFADEEASCLSTLASVMEGTESQLRSHLAKFGFRDVDVFKQVQVLSGGERSRLYLACLLEKHPDLLLLDEPTNHLDIHSREILEKAIAEYEGAVLAVSHDRYFVKTFASRILSLEEGQLKSYDSLQEALQRMLQLRLGTVREEAKASAGADLRSAASRPAEASRAQLPTQETEAHSPLASDGSVSSTLQGARSTSSASGERQVQKRNKSKERQEKARLKQGIADVEKKMKSLQQQIEDCQNSLSPETKPEIYQQLAVWHEELSALEDRYLELLLEWEAFETAEL